MKNVLQNILRYCFFFSSSSPKWNIIHYSFTQQTCAKFMLGTTVVQNCSLHMLSFSEGCTPSPPPSPPPPPPHKHHLHHHIFLGPSFLKLNKYTLHTIHTHTQRIHYQQCLLLHGVFLTLPTHHTSSKSTEKERGKGKGPGVIDYLLAVLCNKTKPKKFKTIWENLQLKQTNGWLENKERVWVRYQMSFFHKNGHQDNYEFLTGAYNPHLRALNECMCVCVCVCVCVSYKSF